MGCLFSLKMWLDLEPMKVVRKISELLKLHCGIVLSDIRLWVFLMHKMKESRREWSCEISKIRSYIRLFFKHAFPYSMQLTTHDCANPMCWKLWFCCVHCSYVSAAYEVISDSVKSQINYHIPLHWKSAKALLKEQQGKSWNPPQMWYLRKSCNSAPISSKMALNNTDYW